MKQKKTKFVKKFDKKNILIGRILQNGILYLDLYGYIYHLDLWSFLKLSWVH